MRASLVWVLVAVAMLSLSGCGKGDAGSGSTSAVDSSATTPAQAAPMKGKDLKDADQVRGGWVTANASADDLVGIEFMADGVMLFSHGDGSAEKLSYSVLEGGRLSMTDPGSSEAMIWNVKLAGDQMELSTERATATGVERDTKRLRKLKKGESLAAAISGLQADRRKLAAARTAAANAFIASDDLVIVSTASGPGAPPAVAIGPADANGIRASWHDDKPPHMDQFRLGAGVASAAGNPQAVASYGQQLQPPRTQQQRGGATVYFEITGDPKSPRAIGKVNYGGKEMELELKRDAALHKQIVERFGAELARLEKIKQPMIDALKDFAVLEGDSGASQPNAPMNTARFTLVRDPATGKYTGEGSLTQPIHNGGTRTSPFAPPSVEIIIIDDKPMLFIDTRNMQYQLSLDETGRKLTGGWFTPGNPNGWLAELEISKAVDAATRKAQVDAERKALTSLSPGAPLIGLSPLPAAFLPQPVPVAFTLASGADGAATGTLVVPIVGGTYAVEGAVADTVSGPRLTLRIGNMTEAGSPHANNLHGSLRSQPWVLAVAGAEAGKPLTLTDGSRTLTQATDKYKAATLKKFTEALSAGMRIEAFHPDYGANQPRHVFQVKRDDTGKITGTTVSAGRGDFHAQSTVEGEVREYAGMPMLAVQMLFPPPARPNDFRRVFASELVAVPTDAGWQFTGPYWPTNSTQSRKYAGFSELKD